MTSHSVYSLCGYNKKMWWSQLLVSIFLVFWFKINQTIIHPCPFWGRKKQDCYDVEWHNFKRYTFILFSLYDLVYDCGTTFIVPTDNSRHICIAKTGNRGLKKGRILREERAKRQQGSQNWKGSIQTAASNPQRFIRGLWSQLPYRVHHMARDETQTQRADRD